MPRPRPDLTDEAQDVMMRIRSIQQSLTELQHKVIRGEVRPDEYRRLERERIQEIHRLEAQLARLMGMPEPERKTRL